MEYRYWFGSDIFIACILSLEPIKAEALTKVSEKDRERGSTADKSKAIDSKNLRDSDKIYVSYELYAPAENLR